jgi:hypothetical protein
MRNGHWTPATRANIGTVRVSSRAEASMETAGSAAESRVQPSAFGCLTVPFLLVALVPLGWGARSQWSKGALLRSGATAPGTVVELRRVPEQPSVRMGKGSVSSPFVRFTPRSGPERIVVGSTNRYPAPWKVGDTVDVVYDADHPERADLRSELEGWRFWFGVWCAVALLPLAIAAAPVVLWLRQSR